MFAKEDLKFQKMLGKVFKTAAAFYFSNVNVFVNIFRYFQNSCFRQSLAIFGQ